ncbi:MAG: right-handed parallel beta-helix repeat-containing protein [Steroidobacteraceae bacterium]
MRKLGIVATTVLAASMPVAFAGPPLQTNTFTVDCAKGQTISSALEQGDIHKPLVINVRGVCREFVTITRANVTLRGDPTAEIVAPDNERDLVTVSADRVWLGNLTLTGGLTGLSQDHEPTFYAENVVIQDTRNIGLRVRVGDARVNNCTVQRAGGIGVSVVRGGSLILGNCQVLDSGQAGVSVTGSSVVNLNSSTVMRSGAEGIVISEGSRGNISASVIKDNGAVGLNVGTSASASVINTTISGNGTGNGPQGDGVMLWGGAQAHIVGENVIIDNRDEGIDVAGAASAYITGARVASNGGNGILGYMGANLVLGNLVIENNGAVGVFCAADCTAQMENMSIHGNKGDGINLSFDSTLMLIGAPIDLAGNVGWGLYCHDAESSVNDTGMVAGTISPTCTGFD